ncbi:MAG: UDP-3-O-(3-hydroxymyristoyl)glucosamine N-acyltransferase [Cocleimonas sp.]|nr:UDP-3-O-(3-hydroxymyristoyl)glucosamine N-acyltransferase [Cocleimonas sp.]
MKFTLSTLAELTHTEFKGDEKTALTNIATLEDARAGDISFVSNPKYKRQLQSTQASVVILSAQLAEQYAGNALISKDPYLTFAKVVRLFNPSKKQLASIHPTTVIDETATIAKHVNIAANVVIEKGVNIQEGVQIGAGCVIGENSSIDQNTRLNANVTLYSDSQIGKNVIIHSGVVIGADGFGFVLQDDKSWYKILQIGNVVIGDDVEIGANTTIDRAALGSTKIANGVKIDNQVIIGHNVQINEDTIMPGGSLVAGSTRIGKRCQIGGGVAIAGHLEIADDVMITGRSMVTNSLKSAGVYSSGITTEENSKWRRNAARFRSLDKMAKQLNQLEKSFIKTQEKENTNGE